MRNFFGISDNLLKIRYPICKTKLEKSRLWRTGTIACRIYSSNRKGTVPCQVDRLKGSSSTGTDRIFKAKLV